MDPAALPAENAGRGRGHGRFTRTPMPVFADPGHPRFVAKGLRSVHNALHGGAHSVTSDGGRAAYGLVFAALLVLVGVVPGAMGVSMLRGCKRDCPPNQPCLTWPYQTLNATCVALASVSTLVVLGSLARGLHTGRQPAVWAAHKEKFFLLVGVMGTVASALLDAQRMAFCSGCRDAGGKPVDERRDVRDYAVLSTTLSSIALVIGVAFSGYWLLTAWAPLKAAMATPASASASAVQGSAAAAVASLAALSLVVVPGFVLTAETSRLCGACPAQKSCLRWPVQALCTGAAVLGVVGVAAAGVHVARGSGSRSLWANHWHFFALLVGAAGAVVNCLNYGAYASCTKPCPGVDGGDVSEVVGGKAWVRDYALGAGSLSSILLVAGGVGTLLWLSKRGSGLWTTLTAPTSWSPTPSPPG